MKNEEQIKADMTVDHDMCIIIGSCTGESLKEFADNGDEVAISIIGDTEVKAGDDFLFLYRKDGEKHRFFSYRNPYLVSNATNNMSNLVQREKAELPGIVNITGMHPVDIDPSTRSSIRDILFTLVDNLNHDKLVLGKYMKKGDREIIEISTM